MLHFRITQSLCRITTPTEPFSDAASRGPIAPHPIQPGCSTTQSGTQSKGSLWNPPRQSGVGLIEVLISLVVIAIGLLGLAALQGKSQNAEMESYQRSQALILLHDMTARLRANREHASNYVAEVGYGGNFSDTSSCSDASKPTATQDLSCWHLSLLGASEQIGTSRVGALIGGHGCITGGPSAFQITIAWQGLSESGISNTDPRKNNLCGQGNYGASDGFRRIVSLPVSFFDEDSTK